MALDQQQQRQEVHSLLDLLPPEKLAAVRDFLEDLVGDEDELDIEDRAAMQVSVDSIETHGTLSMEEVLADFGLTMADFERMADEPDRHGVG